MKKHILLADDSPTIQRLVAQTFLDSPFDVISVSNGDMAIRKLDDVKPLAVLADVYMPGKNGYEVCALVRAHPTLSATPVVLLVGAFDAFDEEHAQQVGASGHITKPFEPQALVDLVKSFFPEELPVPDPEPAAPVATEAAVAAPGGRVEVNDDDLLGLTTLFEEPETPPVEGLSPEDIDRIADRVMQRISSDVIEHIAWDIVPGVVEKVVKEELKKVK